MHFLDIHGLFVFALVSVIFIVLPIPVQEGRSLREMMREFLNSPTERRIK